MGFAKYTKIAKYTTTILKRLKKLNTRQLLNTQRVCCIHIWQP